jgi:uncharacterized membrane protein YdjX (TVP38/TMEM64 family)
MATLVAVAFAVQSGLLGDWLSEAWIDRAVRHHGLAGELLYVAVAGIATAIALPRHVVSFLGGYAFGVGTGTLLGLVATEVGCALSFYYARFVGRPLVGARLGARAARLEDFLAANPFAMTLLIRLLPVGNNFLTNLVAGVTRVRALPFLAGSLLGYLPQTLVFALAGSGVDVGGGSRIAIAVLLFVASALIGGALYHRYRHGKSLGAEVDGALEEDAAPAAGGRGR